MQPSAEALEQYRAARRAAGLADLSSWPRFRFTGPDSKVFLNGLLTNNILALKPGQGLAACLLTPKGRLIADLELYDEGESLLAVMRSGAELGFQAAISKRLPLSKTSIKEAAGTESLFYCSGPGSAGLKAGVRAFPWPRLDDDGWIASVPRAEAEAFKSRASDLGTVLIGPEAWEMRRVERGFPVYGVDMTMEHLPLELRLEPAISMTKGCYMGQETVSRIVNLGHVNRKLTALKTDDAVGAPVLAAGQEVGRVTSAAYSPERGCRLALAVARLEPALPAVDLWGAAQFSTI